MAKRYRVPLDNATWEPISGAMRRGRVEIQLHAAKVVQIFLTYKGALLSKWWVVDQEKAVSAIAASYRLVDATGDKLKSMLFPDKQQARNLEHGAGVLFALLGFSVIPFAASRVYDDAADLVAATPSGRILIIECTFQFNDAQQKALKLIERQAKLRAALEAQALGHTESVPVLFTCIAKPELQAHVAVLLTTPVAVMGREEVSTLLGKLDFFTNAEARFDEIKALVPAPPAPA